MVMEKKKEAIVRRGGKSIMSVFSGGTIGSSRTLPGMTKLKYGDESAVQLRNTLIGHEMDDIYKHSDDEDEKGKSDGRNPIKERQSKHWKILHMKEEKLSFKENVPYHVEFPQRVCTRMLYLMGSTRVALNDPDFVDSVRKNIRREEEIGVRNRELNRERSEQDRIRSLIIKGILSSETVPEDLQELCQHPAYRVNQMLKRLDVYDDTLKNTDVVQTLSKISKIEPYEYDGDAFFKYLHRTGKRNWLPDSVYIPPPKKMTKNRRKYTERKSNNSELSTVFKSKKSEELNSTTEFLENEEESKKIDEKLRLFLIEKPKRLKSEPEMNESKTTRRGKSKLMDKSEVPSSHETEINDELDEVVSRVKADWRRERDEMIERERDKIKEKRSEEEWYSRRRKEDLAHLAKVKSMGTSMYLRLISEPPSPPDLDNDDSWTLLEKEYRIPRYADIHQYRITNPKALTNFIDDATNAKELYKASDQLIKFYVRENMACDKFLMKLGQKLRDINQDPNS